MNNLSGKVFLEGIYIGKFDLLYLGENSTGLCLPKLILYDIDVADLKNKPFRIVVQEYVFEDCWLFSYNYAYCDHVGNNFIIDANFIFRCYSRQISRIKFVISKDKICNNNNNNNKQTLTIHNGQTFNNSSRKWIYSECAPLQYEQVFRSPRIRWERK